MKTHHASPEPLALSLPSTARALGVHVATVRGLAESGAILTVKIGKRRMVPRRELERVLREGTS